MGDGIRPRKASTPKREKGEERRIKERYTCLCASRYLCFTLIADLGGVVGDDALSRLERDDGCGTGKSYQGCNEENCDLHGDDGLVSLMEFKGENDFFRLMVSCETQ